MNDTQGENKSKRVRERHRGRDIERHRGTETERIIKREYMKVNFREKK